MSKYTKAQLKEINRYGIEKIEMLIKMTNDRHSNREISELVFGRMTMASTVHRIQSAFGITGKIGMSMLGKYQDKKQAKESIVEEESIAEEDNPNAAYDDIKVLTFDIETAPILGHVWGLWQNNVGLNQIEKDWYVLSWAAKWMHEDEVKYKDQRDAVDIEDDTELLKGIWKLLDEADIVITQNGKKFDSKKLNARFVLAGMKPPSHYRHIDTLQIAKKSFAFTSNKLEYMTDKLCKKYKKQTHQRFAGFELWKQCLANNEAAWDEMEQYNIYDVLSLEELYHILAPWDNTLFNFNVYRDDLITKCSCGCEEFTHKGYAYTNLSKFDKFTCDNCGRTSRGRVNLLSKEKRATLRANII